MKIFISKAIYQLQLSEIEFFSKNLYIVLRNFIYIFSPNLLIIHIAPIHLSSSPVRAWLSSWQRWPHVANKLKA